MKMKKNFFAEKKLIFVDGSSSGIATAAEAMPKAPEPPQAETQPGQPAMPETAPALPTLPKAPETTPVTESAVLEAAAKTKEAAAKKFGATGKDMNTLANLIKVPA